MVHQLGVKRKEAKVTKCKVRAWEFKCKAEKV